MNAGKLEAFRNKLRTLRERLDRDAAGVRAEALRGSGGENAGGLSNAPVHIADMGSQEAEERVALGLAENEAFLLREVEDALGRIQDGTFGKCEECAKPIDPARLDVLPYCRTCIRCAEKAQRRSG
jgi:RNA polymerase-binding transcription factor DksA